MRARVVLIAIPVAVYALLAALLAGGVAIAWDGFEEARTPAVDLAVRCDGNRTPCLESEPGRVRADDDEDDIYTVFATERGVVYAALTESETPAPPRRVQLEWWNGDVVAVVDVATGRRYKTDDWAQGWAAHNYEPVVKLAFAAFMLVFPVLSLVGGVGLVLLRVRREAA